MKKIFFITGIILFVLITTSIVYACEPCTNTLNFEETVNKSDLIIVGQRIGEGPRSDFGEGYGGPDWIKVRIIEILKGSSQDTMIKVNSWDAMCSYGIIINDNKNYVMLLQERESIEEEFQYDAVDFGCAQKTYSVENNEIDFEGNKISIDEFTNKLGSQATRKILDNKSQDQTSVIYYIISAIVILIILFLIIIKIKKK